MFGLIDALKDRNIDEDEKIFELINEAAAKGVPLSEEQWHEILIRTHKRILFHEKQCLKRNNAILWLLSVLILMVAGDKIPAIVSILS